MHGTIESAFIGRVGSELELRTSNAGKPWARFSVAVGREDETQWISVAVFGETAERLCQALHKGDRVYVEGTLRLSEWTGRDGEKRTGLSVAAWKAEKLGAIGRNKPPKRRATGSASEPEAPAGNGSEQHDQRPQPALDDRIPF